MIKQYRQFLQNLSRPATKFLLLTLGALFYMGQDLIADCAHSTPLTPEVACSQDNQAPCQYGGEFCNLGDCPGKQNVCWYDAS